MNNQDILNKIEELKKSIGALENEYYKNNFSARQDFVKYSDFKTRLKIPHYASAPATCEIGEIIEVGGVEKICSAANTWSNVGSSTPGGSDTQVQFNDSSSFGGDSAFVWNKTSNIMTLDNGTASATLGTGVKITGGTSGIQIRSDDKSSNNTETGSLDIRAGINSGDNGIGGSLRLLAGHATDNDGQPGDIEMTAGSAGDVDIAFNGNSHGGNVDIAAGSSGPGNGGVVTIAAGSSLNGGTGGTVHINLGGGTTYGYFQINGGGVQPNVAFGTATSFASGQGVIYIRNRTTAPSGTPSTGGVLYVEAGALHFKGSGGTDTIIAPA